MRTVLYGPSQEIVIEKLWQIFCALIDCTFVARNHNRKYDDDDNANNDDLIFVYQNLISLATNLLWLCVVVVANRSHISSHYSNI